MTSWTACPLAVRDAPRLPGMAIWSWPLTSGPSRNGAPLGRRLFSTPRSIPQIFRAGKSFQPLFRTSWHAGLPSFIRILIVLMPLLPEAHLPVRMPAARGRSSNIQTNISHAFIDPFRYHADRIFKSGFLDRDLRSLSSSLESALIRSRPHSSAPEAKGKDT